MEPPQLIHDTHSFNYSYTVFDVISYITNNRTLSYVVFRFYTAGAGFNPAVSFGSAIVSQVWDAHYIYWVGPMAGAGIASLLFRSVNSSFLVGSFCFEGSNEAPGFSDKGGGGGGHNIYANSLTIKSM